MASLLSAQRAPFAADLTVIVIALALVGVVVHRERSGPTPRHPDQGLSIGSPVMVGDVAWSRVERTLLLFLHEGCRFCAESAPFYKKVLQQPGSGAVQIIAVLPHTVEHSRKYLRALGLQGIAEVRATELSTVGIRSTPTLVVVDRKGTAIGLWTGRLDTRREEQVLAVLLQR